MEIDYEIVALKTDTVEKLDTVLRALSSGQLLYIEAINMNIKKITGEAFSIEMIIRLLKHLQKDGFVEFVQSPGYATITFEGLFFMETSGYVKKLYKNYFDDKAKKAETEQLFQLSVQGAANQRRLNILTFWLTIGTISAALIALLLLIWQVYIYYHPTPVH